MVNCESEKAPPFYMGSLKDAYNLGLSSFLGPYSALSGVDPFRDCTSGIQDMELNGDMYPANDWQSKNDIIIQAGQSITAPTLLAETTHIKQSPNYLPTTHNADYTFRAGTRINLKPGFAVERENRFRAEIGSCISWEPDCGTNYAARPVHEVDENSFFETAAAQKQGELFIQPNPSNGQIQLALPEEGGFLRLYNANGQLIWQQANCNQRLELDFSQFQAGFYLLQWQDEEEMQTKKLILR